MYKNILIVLSFLALTSLFAQENRRSSSSNGSTLDLSAGAISVTIGGSFVMNGSFPASPLERVDQFITRLFTQTKLQYVANVRDQNSMDQLNLTFDNYARRNIILKRFNGEEIHLDLEKFRLTGDFKYNPYLRNDDILIFPKVDIERGFIAIDGAVNNPTKFQFVQGDKLSDAILFAQGLSPAYQNIKQAEITRLSYDGSRENIQRVDINSDTPLQPGDRIRILADETFRKDYRVLVLGEVTKPGYIYIAKDNVTIKSVIEKAGGFKNTADLFNAELIRATDNYTYYRKDILTKSFEQNRQGDRRMENSLYQSDIMENLLMSRMSYLEEPEDSMYFKIDNDLRLLRGNGLVDFTNLDSDTSASKFLVKDGDVIFIPEKRDLVYIFGQVASAGYVKYKPGADVNYYIEQAGGLGELARNVEDINIIKAKSRSWSTVGSKQTTIIEPGDYIWVPKQTPRTFTYYFDKYMTRIGQVASVVGTIVTIILLTRK